MEKREKKDGKREGRDGDRRRDRKDRNKSGSPDRRDGDNRRRDRKGRDSDSDSDSDDGMAREYWNKFARMDYRQYSQGYRHAEPGVTDEQIKDSFLWGDKNGDFMLNFHEFKRMVAVS